MRNFVNKVVILYVVLYLSRYFAFVKIKIFKFIENSD